MIASSGLFFIGSPNSALALARLIIALPGSGILVADYEETHLPILPPTLSEAIKLRMHERGLAQKALSEGLGVSISRISEYLNGKSEPTLKIAREISRKLDIEASIVLGV